MPAGGSGGSSVESSLNAALEERRIQLTPDQMQQLAEMLLAMLRREALLEQQRGINGDMRARAGR